MEHKPVVNSTAHRRHTLLYSVCLCTGVCVASGNSDLSKPSSGDKSQDEEDAVDDSGKPANYELMLCLLVDLKRSKVGSC